MDPTILPRSPGDDGTAPPDPVAVLQEVLPLIDEYQRVLESLGHAPPLCDYAVREDVRDAISRAQGDH